MSDSDNLRENKKNSSARHRRANIGKKNDRDEDVHLRSESANKATRDIISMSTLSWTVIKQQLRQKVAMPILIFLSKRNTNTPPRGEGQSESQLQAVPFISPMAYYLNRVYQQYYKLDNSKRTDGREQLSIDEMDVMVGLIGLAGFIILIPLFVTLYVNTQVLQKCVLQLGGTWLYPLWITYSHLEQYAYEKVGFFILVWICLCFFQCMEQNYLYFQYYRYQNQNGLSFTYIIIKTFLLHILLHPKWEFIVPILYTLTNQKHKYDASPSERNDTMSKSTTSSKKKNEGRKPWSLDWDEILHRRRISREKMTSQSSSLANDNNKHINTTRICDEKKDTNRGGKSYNACNNNGTGEDISLSDSSCSGDSFSYVHVEEGENNEPMGVTSEPLSLPEDKDKCDKNSLPKKSPSSPLSSFLSKINHKNIDDINVENNNNISNVAIPTEITTPQKDNTQSFSSSPTDNHPDKIEELKN